jgi:glycosyltransferase involved in cell wall biosynthesis
MAEAVDDFTVCLMAKQEENRQWEIGPVPFKTEVLNGFHMKMRSSKISAHWNYGVISALRRMNPDVVMSGGFTPANVEAYLYCKLFGRAYVGWGEFSLRDNARSSAIRRALRRWMTKGSAASIASSSEAHDAFLHYGAKRHTICTALMPIDVERFHREASEFRHAAVYEDRRTRFSKPIILSVGRLTDRK